MSTYYYLYCKEHNKLGRFYDVQSLGTVLNHGHAKVFMDRHNCCGQVQILSEHQVPDSILFYPGDYDDEVEDESN